MGDLTPESFRGLDERINGVIMRVGEYLDEKWNQMLEKIDHALDDMMEKLTGFLGSLFGKAGNAVKAPLQRKPSGPTPIARSRQPTIQKEVTAPAISQSVQCQVASLGIPQMNCADIGTAAPNCQAYNAPRINAGVGSHGLQL